MKLGMSLVEYGVQNYPEGFEDWRFYRIEYLAHDKPYAIKECHLWLPPKADACVLEDLFEKWQNEDETAKT